jgi:hypothetical protein
MAVLVHRSYFQPSVNLAADLRHYGSDAQWCGVYYRGEKIGFTVRQTVPIADGFELQEDGQLEMTLLGATTAAKIHTAARVNEAFLLRSFEFSLDPGTGPIRVDGRVEPLSPSGTAASRLILGVTSSGETRTEEHDLAEPPMLTLNMGRRLASEGLRTGERHQWMVFDPATLQNAPVVLDVGGRELVRIGDARTAAFRVDVEFSGLRTVSWVTDTGEVVREESPLGLLTVRESAARATVMAVPGQIQSDLLQAAAVVPETKEPIDEPANVLRLRMRLAGADLSSPDIEGGGQHIDGDIVEIGEPRPLAADSDRDTARYLEPEVLIESDAPEIRSEAIKAVGDIAGPRARAERLVRYVNGLLDKKPTVSIPSAREVLRTKIGDCNEHTALYVAMARAIGIPARIAVGLTYVRDAFYYHAWAEVYLEDGMGQAVWLPADPTFNQFPADRTHLRLGLGGLDKQTAILPLIGRLKITLLDVEVVPGSRRVLVGSPLPGTPAVPATRRHGLEGWCGCWW